MAWLITHKPSHDNDFIDLPKDLQRAFSKGHDELRRDPITPRGDTIKKLKGWDNVYRLRRGDFRLIYAADRASQIVQLLAVGPRDSVYERFNYDGWDAPGAARTFGPEMAAAPEWTNHPEWFGRQAARTLPRRLTPELLSRWRIEPQFHATLTACRTEDELEAAAVPQETLLRVYDSLWPPSAGQLAGQPDQMLFDSDDLIRYAEGTLAGFLLRLDEQQEPLTRWALRGPTLVKGGPGSGKSTVALYRLRALIEHHRRTSGGLPSILFATYTNSLIHFSESLLRQLLGDLVPLTHAGKLPPIIRVSTLHSTATMIARGSGQEYRMAGESDKIEALHAARAALRPAAFGEVAKLRLTEAIGDLRDDYLLEEFEWVIEGQNCRVEADYLAADRTGRGIPFTRERRGAVWQLYAAYRDYLLARDLYTWGHLTQTALDQVRSGAFTRRWEYVIVDEAQDLTPAALALAVELCREPGGVFLTADANQSLYNRGFRWGNVHASLRVAGRTRTLRRNYRSTRQIAAAAAEIVAGRSEADGEAAAQEYIHAGPRPVLYAAAGSTDQWRRIARFIYESARELRLPANAAVVLVTSGSLGGPVATALSDRGLPARYMNSRDFDLEAPCIKVTTLHAAKGLEFPIVVVAHAETGRLPWENGATEPEEIAAFEECQRRLFYVGCTRAMRRLLVTYDRGLASPFLAGLSQERWEQ